MKCFKHGLPMKPAESREPCRVSATAIKPFSPAAINQLQAHLAWTPHTHIHTHTGTHANALAGLETTRKITLQKYKAENALKTRTNFAYLCTCMRVLTHTRLYVWVILFIYFLNSPASILWVNLRLACSAPFDMIWRRIKIRTYTQK